MKQVYVYILDTMADWELAHLLPELHSGQYFKKAVEPFHVTTVGATNEPVTTKGGLKLVPDMSVSELQAAQASLLLLPGADTWNDAKHGQILNVARQLLADGTLVGAICGATAALAGAGMLNDRPHTSNALQFLQMNPQYKGTAHYRDEPVVADGNLVTASAAASLEFARVIIEQLGVFSQPALAAWYNYFKTAEPHYFYDLLQTLPQHN